MLIYDSTEGAAETLRELLAREGLHAVTTDSATQLREFCDTHRPGVLVIDTDESSVRDRALAATVCESARRNAALIVVLGTKKSDSVALGPGEFVRKPYHYGPLVRRICAAAAARGTVSSRAA